MKNGREKVPNNGDATFVRRELWTPRPEDFSLPKTLISKKNNDLFQDRKTRVSQRPTIWKDRTRVLKRKIPAKIGESQTSSECDDAGGR